MFGAVIGLVLPNLYSCYQPPATVKFDCIPMALSPKVIKTFFLLWRVLLSHIRTNVLEVAFWRWICKRNPILSAIHFQGHNRQVIPSHDIWVMHLDGGCGIFNFRFCGCPVSISPGQPLLVWLLGNTSSKIQICCPPLARNGAFVPRKIFGCLVQVSTISSKCGYYSGILFPFDEAEAFPFCNYRGL